MMELDTREFQDESFLRFWEEKAERRRHWVKTAPAVC